MKLREFRNSGVQDRLNRAARTWLLDNPKRSFREPETISVSQIIKWILYGLLFALLLTFLWFSKEDGPLFLAVLLPFAAIITFLKIAQIQAAPASSGAIHLLPIDDHTLTRQIRTDQLKSVIEGLILSSVLGAFGANETISLTGALQGLLIFLGLLGCLTIAYFWRFFEILTFLAKGSAALLFAGMVIDRLKGFNRSLLEATPWFKAFNSPLILVAFLALGAAIAWFTRNRWSKVTRFNRTAFYQNAKAAEPEIEADGTIVFEAAFLPLSTPSKGLIERLIWRFLTIKERGLLRAVGGHSSALLSAWIKTTLVFLSVIWLARFSWPPFMDAIRPIAPIIVLGFMTVTTGLCNSIPTRYLHGLSIGPHATAPRFQALPLTLTALEKLMWKTGILRWILMALTLGAATLIGASSQASLQSFSVTVLIILALILHLSWTHFWACSINGWSSAQGRAKIWIIFIQIVLALGIIFTFGYTSFFFVTIFQGTDLYGNIGRGGIIIAAFIIYQIILRFLIRAFISDTQSDLVSQAK